MHYFRAYATLELAAAGDDALTLTGIATTPTPDRNGDIVDPLGVTFKNPVPLLLHHDKQRPIGTVRFNPPTAAGVTFAASLIKGATGRVGEWVDEAVQLLKAGVLRAVSIGYAAKPDDVEYDRATGCLRFKACELCELSLVTVPANADATITAIKALDAPYLAAATGRVSLSGVPDARRRGVPMTNSESINSWTVKRGETAALMAAMMQRSTDAGVTLNDDERSTYDNYRAEIAAIDAQILNLKELEAIQARSAVPAAPASRPPASSSASIVTLRSDRRNEEFAFARAVGALITCKFDRSAAVAYCERRYRDDPLPSLVLKAAVAPGTTTDPAWAGPLVPPAVTSAFVEMLRPRTVIGRLAGLTPVPFNAPVPIQTGGGAYHWVGETKPKPVTKLAFAKATLTITKVAAIIPITEELARLSSPSAEMLVQQSMVKGIAQYLDVQFLDPTVAAVAGVNPASITNGITPIATTGDPIADLKTLIGTFTANNVPLEGSTLLMSDAAAFALATTVTANGVPFFPNLSVAGGSVYGVNVVTSASVGTLKILVHNPDILVADDGGVEIDVSREASIQMSDAPDDPTVATSVLVSLWQNNLIGIRAERFINWLRSRPVSVALLAGTVGPAPASEPFNGPMSTTDHGHDTTARKR